MSERGSSLVGSIFERFVFAMFSGHGSECRRMQISRHFGEDIDCTKESCNFLTDHAP